MLGMKGGLWREHLLEGGVVTGVGLGKGMMGRSLHIPSALSEGHPQRPRACQQWETGPGAQRRGQGRDVGLGITGVWVALCHGHGTIMQGWP